VTPESAEAWDTYARSLAALGKKQEAAQAAARAKQAAQAAKGGKG